MTNYWDKIGRKLNKKERFNYVNNRIDELLNETSGEEEEEESLGKISVSVKDAEEQGIANATVSLEGTDFEGTTGGQGGCNITNVPYGQYTITVTCDGYETASETINVNSETVEFECTLTATEGTEETQT